MTITRWKVMAGALGLSLGGLAAVAEPPAPVTPAIPPVHFPTVTPTSVPATYIPAVPVVSGGAPAPVAPCPTASGICPEVPTVSAKRTMEVLPAPRPVAEQELTLTVPAAAVAVPGDTAPQAIPVAAAEPAPAVASVPVMAPASPPVMAPAPVAAPSPATLPVQQTAPVAVVQQAAAPAAVAAVVADKKLRVLLNMGEDRPRFEVKDGEETLLKLVSDKVDVKSPADRGETLPTMKAVGTVTFFTPGGEGTCDELTLTPGTGQVVVTGKVRFTYHWGKVETEVSGDRMMFRLGAAPGVVTTSAPATGVMNAVPASYHPSR